MHIIRAPVEHALGRRNGTWPVALLKEREAEIVQGGNKVGLPRQQLLGGLLNLIELALSQVTLDSFVQNSQLKALFESHSKMRERFLHELAESIDLVADLI